MFEQVKTEFATFHREFAPLFGRPQTERRGEQYLRGLLVQQTDRRNAENIAEAVEAASPRAWQRFLTESPWSSARVMERLQRTVILKSPFHFRMTHSSSSRLLNLRQPTTMLDEGAARHCERNAHCEPQRVDCVRMVHLQQNAQAYVTRQEWRPQVGADIRAIFNAPNRAEAEALLTKTVQISDEWEAGRAYLTHDPGSSGRCLARSSGHKHYCYGNTSSPWRCQATGR